MKVTLEQISTAQLQVHDTLVRDNDQEGTMGPTYTVVIMLLGVLEKDEVRGRELVLNN
jgi:hypothetical protein